MRRSQTAGAALTLLFLPAAAPPAPSCALPVGQFRPSYGAPVPVSPVDTLRRVVLQKNAVVAEEVQEIAVLQWETSDPVTVRFEGKAYRFPAGSTLSRLNTSRGEMDCFWEAARLGNGPGADRGMVTCLTDTNGDNRRETATLLDLARGDGVSTLPTEGATRLMAQGAGSDDDVRAYRRIRVASVSRTRAELVLEHGSASGDRKPVFSRFAAGSLRVPLQAGEVRFGGLALRLQAGEGGWTITPLEPRFPDWVDIECGSRIVIGKAKATAAPSPAP